MKIEKEFYLTNDVVSVSRQLLGKVLCTQFDGKITKGIIVETEAYAGETDKASHAYGGRRTARTEIMYAEGGTAYVYLCYGIHSLFNVVTNQKDIPHAVLIRGIKPLEGIELMQERTGKAKLKKSDGIGPGKVSKLLGIHVSHTGLSLLNNEIWLEDHHIKIPTSEITIDKRVGIDYAQEDAQLPYRFIWKK